LAQRVYLHVGTPKSGTTYLQAGLWQNRDALRDLGLLFPGRGPFDQNRASIVVRNGKHLPGRKKTPRLWKRIVSETTGFDGTVVLSNEWYLTADQEQIAAAVEQLGGEVHVVVTTRSLVRIVPAAWQESLKVGRGHSLGDFVDGLADGRIKWTWDVIDPAAVARHWAGVVGPERVHVVTMPERPTHAGQLWERFAATVGFDPHAVELPPREANESMTVQAARLMQEFGPALKDEVDRHDASWRGHARWLRTAVVRKVLADVPGDPIGVGEELRAVLLARGERSVADLRDLGCAVTGDLEELLGGTDRDGSRHPDTVTDEELLEASRLLAVGLLAGRIEASSGGNDADDDEGDDEGDDESEPDDTADSDEPDTGDTDNTDDSEDDAVETDQGPRGRRGKQRRPPGVDYADTVATHRADVTDRTRRWTFMVPSAYAAGGIARTVFTTANSLAARGHEVRILTLGRSSAEPKFRLDPAVELVALQDRYDPDNPGKPRRATKNDPKADPALRELDRTPSRLVDGAKKTFSALVDQLLREQLEGRPPGVVVSTRPEFAVAASLWSDPGSILLHQEHLSFVPRPEPLRAALRDLALGRGPARPIDALLTLTEADHERWRDYLAEQQGDRAVRTGVIPNPTPFQVGEPAPLTTKVVIAAGRLTAQKGFERLVEAWVPLATSHPDWQLRIYGDGQRWDDLNAQVAAAGVGDRILMGGVTDELEAELADSAIYAMSSRYEGLPMVLLEALSKGVPPVSFDCPEGPRQLIDDGVNGLLVPEGDVPALTAALQRLMDDEDLRRRLGAQALETARDYEADAVTDRWIALAEEIAAERG
jgi:glycosyltransferase involved in cell wall biosynthesis